MGEGEVDLAHFPVAAVAVGRLGDADCAHSVVDNSQVVEVDLPVEDVVRSGTRAEAVEVEGQKDSLRLHWLAGHLSTVAEVEVEG